MNTSSTKKHDYVQVLNPKTERYIKIDRAVGVVVSSKPTRGPYKNVPIVSKPK